MKITKLGYQKKDPNRVNVYVDEKYVAGIDINDVVKLGIYNGQEISQDELKKIIGESEFGKLFNSALNFLSYRPRSEWEIRHKLKFKTEDGQLIETVIDKLKKIGQVNDVDFAKWYIDQRQTFKPMGRRAVKYELIKKGLINKTINDTLSEQEGQIGDKELAERVAEKFVGRLRKIDYNQENIPKTKNKLQRLLASRGFDWEVIDETVEKYLKKG